MSHIDIYSKIYQGSIPVDSLVQNLEACKLKLTSGRVAKIAGWP